MMQVDMYKILKIEEIHDGDGPDVIPSMSIVDDDDDLEKIIDEEAGVEDGEKTGEKDG